MENLNFVPKPVDAVGIRPAGASIQISKAVIQRTTALSAYNSFASGRRWMEKLSAAYVVALATRSADTMLMQDIQNHIPEEPRIGCAKCREATIGLHVIRARIFPRLTKLRRHANALVHHLDDPKNRGIDGLNIGGVFEYCYHLFQENADALFGQIPTTSFELTLCKVCAAKSASNSTESKVAD